jgi:hypothetical protein
MSNRLNQEREKKLEPKRMNTAINEITKLGYSVHSDDKSIYFDFKGSTITYWPYSGWASGKTIKDGRGLKKLLDQIKESDR